MATFLAPAQAATSASMQADDDLPIPPLISLHAPLERISSTPSSFSPSVATASGSSRSYFAEPAEEAQGTKEKYDDDIAEIRKTLGSRLHLSKSMQAMRPAVQTRASGLVDRKDVNLIVMPRAASGGRSRSASAVPMAAPMPPTRPPLAQKQSGGFAAFLRKLTGRSSSPPKSKNPPRPTPTLAQAQAQQPIRSSPQYRSISPQQPETAAPAVSQPASMMAPRGMYTPMSRAASATVVSSRPILPALDVNIPPPVSAPSSAPPAPEATMILPGPTPFASPVQAFTNISQSPVEPSEQPPVDPREIPLPLSPLLEPINNHESEEADELDDVVPPLTFVNGTSPNRAQMSAQSANLSSDSSDTDAPEDMTDDGSESEDTVRELEPHRMPPASRPYTGHITPSTPNSVLEEIVTPTSAVSTPAYYDSRFAGNSPPSKAPVAIDAGNELGRKGSKWRRSMMGLSDTLNQKTLSKKTSVREPPSSYDAYALHQKRIANNRVSCAPILASNATIAAGLSKIEDDEGRDMAETFFM